MRRQTLIAAAMVAMVMGASTANAAISFDLIPVDNSAALTGYVTYDMQATTDADWTAAAMLLDMSVGSIYQEPEGWPHAGVTFGPPDPAWFPYFPTAEFDTYLVGDVLTTSIAGGAGDVGGDAYRFDTQELDVSWYNITENDIGTITIGRVTLTDDAEASLGVFLTVDADFGQPSSAEFTVTIAPGASPLVSQMIEEPEASGFGEIDWGGSTYEPSGDIDRSAYYVTSGELFQRRLESWDMYPSRQPRNIVLSDSGNYFVSLSDPGGFFTSQPEPVDTTSDNGVPEPASLLLITTCLGMIILRRRFPKHDA